MRDQKLMFVTSAAPGFFLVQPIEDETGRVCDASRTPIVAWGLDAQGVTVPITPQEAISEDEDPAILSPDGAVQTYSKCWNSLTEWLADCIQPPAKTVRPQIA